ncbi:MAG: hypothetical protein J7K59_04930 [Candidatus Korarchaeota archaeon]|nr:hypothetical protein [Candidatus Korarchaeota archaeon]
MKLKGLRSLFITFILLSVISNSVAGASQTSSKFLTKTTISASNIKDVTYMALVDIDNNGDYEILVAQNNTLLLLNHTGSAQFDVIFNISLENSIRNVLAADFDGNGELEFAAVHGNVVSFVGVNGTILMTTKIAVDGLFAGVFDIDLDGKLDYILEGNATTNPFYLTDVYGGNSSISGIMLSELPSANFIVTDFDEDSNRTHHLVFIDADRVYYYNKLTGLEYYSLGVNLLPIITVGNFSLEVVNSSSLEFVVIGENNTVFFISLPTGQNATIVKWKTTISGINRTIYAPIAADFDNDGLDEIAVASLDGYIRVIGDGDPTKEYFVGNVSSNGAITDIYNNNLPDCIFALENGSIIGINNTGSWLLGTYPGSKYPLIGDINGDGISELLIFTSSGLQMIDLTNAQGDWTYFTHDTRNTNNFGTLSDYDGDGIPDNDEVSGLLLNDADTDNDELIDFTEKYYFGTTPTSADTDSDNMPDGWEVKYNLDPLNASDSDLDNDFDNITNVNEFSNGTSPLSNDTDDDALTDWEEIEIYGTKPADEDSDDDRMPDGWEIQYGFNPLDSDDAFFDNDTDELENVYEYLNGTDPLNSDSDSDSLPDGWEVKYGLNPLNALDAVEDDDEDGLRNFEEYIHKTNPIKNDTDDDDLPDLWEINALMDPNDPTDNTTDLDDDGLTNVEEYKHKTDPRSEDTDGDGLPDKWEIDNGYNPIDANDSLWDEDGDGLTTLEEYTYGTDPLLPDTDNDSLGDFAEINTYRTDPTDSDTDDDGLLDGEEIILGTNPFKEDTDGDGVSDYEEIMRGTDPLDPSNGLSRLLTFISAFGFSIAILFIIYWKRKK